MLGQVKLRASIAFELLECQNDLLVNEPNLKNMRVHFSEERRDLQNGVRHP